MTEDTTGERPLYTAHEYFLLGNDLDTQVLDYMERDYGRWLHNHLFVVHPQLLRGERCAVEGL